MKKFRPRAKFRPGVLPNIHRHLPYFGLKHWQDYGSSWYYLDCFKRKTLSILYYKAFSSVATKQHKRWEIVYNRLSRTRSKISKRLHKFKNNV